MGILPDILNDTFTLYPHIIIKQRQEVTYKIPYCKTNIRQLTFVYVGPIIWNTFIIQHFLQDSISTHIFKKRVKYLVMCNEKTVIYTYEILDLTSYCDTSKSCFILMVYVLNYCIPALLLSLLLLLLLTNFEIF